MSENEPNTFEKTHESIPTPEEVQSVFEQLIEGKYESEPKCEDEKGLYSWDVFIPGEDGKIEYGYRRFSEGGVSSGKIHIVFYDKEGVPRGGHDVAEYIDGNWKLTP